MTTLHIINRTDSEVLLVKKVLRVMSDGDALMLIEDGVYALLDGACFDAVAYCVYALDADMEARGVTVCTDCDVIITGYKGFVTLSLDFSKTVTW